MANKSTLKKGKKKWFDIYASKEFREQIIGETPAYDINELKGRAVIVDIGKIADVKKPNARLIFQVTEVKDKGGFTELFGYEIPQSHLKRSVRINSSKIADSLKLKTKDNVEIIIKPMLITKGKAARNVLKSLRKVMIEELKREIGERDYIEVLMDIIRNKIQVSIKNNVKKIHPVTFCDFSKVQRRG
ncbi:MAG: hypothetical protein PHG05_01705 [Candidatus Nanoarchaeia archaeon]|nr:hypothetical protein [Candidatus Nanoarchaeia archaeon]